MKTHSFIAGTSLLVVVALFVGVVFFAQTTLGAPLEISKSTLTNGMAVVCWHPESCQTVTAEQANAQLQSLFDAAVGESESLQYLCDQQSEFCSNGGPVAVGGGGRLTYVACQNGSSLSATYFNDTPPAPPTANPQCVASSGNACTETSSSNSCGMSASTEGTIQCDGSCSVGAPAVPSDSLCTTNNPTDPPGGGGGGGGGSGGGSGSGSPGAGAPGIGTNSSQSIFALLTATPSSIIRGLSSHLMWDSRNARSCTGVNFDTKGKTSGEMDVSPLEPTLYILTCTDSAGNNAFDAQNVTVSAPELSISAKPDLVQSGQPSLITWEVTGTATSCVVSGPGLSSTEFAGSSSEIITQASTYTLSCEAGAFTTSASVTVKIAPDYREI